MGKYLILFLLFPAQVFADAPECPIQKNKRSCLAFVEENDKKFREFIDGSTSEDDLIQKEQMIEAAVDIKKYETLACQKTCLN